MASANRPAIAGNVLTFKGRVWLSGVVLSLLAWAAIFWLAAQVFG